MKSLLYISSSMLLFASSTLAPSLLSYQNQKIVTMQSMQEEKNEILDFDKLIQKASESAMKIFVPGSEVRIKSIDTSNLSYANLEVKQNGDISWTDDVHGFFFGESIFENNLDKSQVMTTNSYEKTIENSVSHSVTYGFSAALKAKFSFLENELTFSYNETKTTTKTTEIFSKSPPQSFTIPAKSKYKVTTFLGKRSSKVDVNLNADVSGDLKIKYNNDAIILIPIHIAFATLEELPKGISINANKEIVNFQGIGYATAVEQNDLFSVLTEKIE